MGWCLWLDGSLLKACRVLKARLEPLGYLVVCRHSLPDRAIDSMAARMGCVVASTDQHIIRAVMLTCWTILPQEHVERKSARDLATLILKQVYRQCLGPMSPGPS
ncbi:MAG: hypothetical protein DSY37_03220 [Hyperthermus sp.]|nr:MAG: hypothetical protein DSY37_03220 [Hyperthermus sp.]